MFSRPQIQKKIAVVFGATFAFLQSASPWSGMTAQEGPLRIAIADIAEITDVTKSVPVSVMVANSADTLITARVEVKDLVDGWRVLGKARVEIALDAGQETDLVFNMKAGKAIHSALYPLHVYASATHAGERHSLHAVRVFSVRLPPEEAASGTDLPRLRVPARGAFPLWMSDKHRVGWHYFDGPVSRQPVGWTGSTPISRASMAIRQMMRGTSRPCLNLHPPWKPGGGSVFCDYLLQLPQAQKITFSFANAIRDSAAAEPLSDGVLFRVWVGTAVDGTDLKPVFERFTASKVWVPGEVVLDPFAGQTVLLRIESHPGPNLDTRCDSSYWAEPTIVLGVPPPVADLIEPATQDEVDEVLAHGPSVSRVGDDGALRWCLMDPATQRKSAIIIRPGHKGLLDAAVTLGNAAGSTSFHGLLIDIEDVPAGRWPSPCAFRSVQALAIGDRHRFRHIFEREGRDVPLDVTVYPEGPGIRFMARSSERISLLSVGPWTRKAHRVVYGHGYYIEEPEAFRAGFGGHNLASSHVGLEFDDHIAVLQAVDTPPNAFVVDPATRTYALTTHMNTTLTLVPAETPFSAAVAYRPLYDKGIAGGVERLAGRFCFDIWGGRYADIADRMAEMIRYGLTDSFITVHNWQRWGYDYRLPDIYPPNPILGTISDLQRLSSICRANDIPWGLHDNYIDFYPDAEDFTYRHVYFMRNGQPNPAWYNRGRAAQSYKWRPDRILPFVKRNFRLIRNELHPTHSFLDVFTSSGCMDYWNDQGGFHSSLETRKHWGETFAWIRDYLGDNAPTTSEAGHDQLIGYLDGADCQWLRLAPKGEKHVIGLRCAAWERVPWYDAVNHHRFILHGVGYSTRYQGGRSRQRHGINSDDYISAEILTGHALMADGASWGRGAVRKYYLAQDAMRHLALKAISTIRFPDGGIERQHVSWSDGTAVHVNRSNSDWRVAGHVLPPYGFIMDYRQGQKCYHSSFSRSEEGFGESSVGPSGWYCNARTTTPDASRELPIEPRLENVTSPNGSTIKWDIVWHAEAPTGSDLKVFVHCCSDASGRDDKIVFQDDHSPELPTSQWQGDVRVTRTVTIPREAAGEVDVMVGLYGPHGRALLRGHQGGESRILLGTLQITGNEDERQVTLSPPPPPVSTAPPSLNPQGTRIDFGFAVTDGAFRVQNVGEALRLLPLPDSPPFALTIRLDRLGLPGNAAVSAVTSVPSASGQEGESMKFSQEGSALSFRHDGASFGYRVTW